MSEKPLQNVIICCTSVTQDERSAIMRQALEMGAVIQADLTSNVTHLIVARLQTEKYRFAARHRTDLQLMSVEWIPAIHTIWITGKDVNLPWSEEKFRLPVFLGLRICVTNLDADLRTHIEQIVTRNGATYTGDLTKENTHLIAGSASGKKWEAVNSWQCDISIVGIEWVYESMKRGASLDEKYFRLELSPEVRGQSSWFPPKPVARSDTWEDLSTESTKRKRPPAQSGPRKRLAKRASTLMADGLWDEILKPDSVSKQVAPPDEANTDLPTIQLDLPTENSAFTDTPEEQLRNDILPDNLTRGIFEGRSFYIVGFDRRQADIVYRTLTSHGGRVVQSEAPDTIAIMPQDGNPPTTATCSLQVTEFWLERCLSAHKFEDPTTHFTSKPFRSSFPIPKMEQLSICTSGFSAVESMHIEKMIKLVGGIYCDTLTKARSVLLAASRDCRKFKLAKDNGTRVVKVEWLWECIRRSKMIGVTDFALDGVLGSRCRIDGMLAIKARRAALLKDTMYHIDESCRADCHKLKNMMESMGGSCLALPTDSALTHYISNVRPRAALDSHVYQVTPAWVVETYALMQRQPESAYLSQNAANDENIPPDKASSKKAYGVKALDTNAQRLATEMHEIRQRISSGATRRASRKILGRATTLPCINDEPLMLATNAEEDTLDTAHEQSNAASQGVTYSDPDAVAVRRGVLMKLKAASASSMHESPSIITANVNMRAVGLDDGRKLRR